MDSNSIAQLFQLSTWQSWVAVLFLVLTFTTLIIFKRKKKFNNSRFFLFAISLGLIGGLIFLLISFFTGTNFSTIGPDDYYWESEVINWLSLTTTIFISLIVFFVPLLIFTTIIKTLINENHNSSLKDIIISIATLVSITAIGILLAFVFIPLTKTIYFQVPSSSIPPSSGVTNIIDMIEGWVPSSISIFASTQFIISIVIVSFIFVVIIKNLRKTNLEASKAIESFFNHFNKILIEGVKIVLILVPFMVASKLPTLFINVYGIKLKDYLTFIGIILLAVAIIIIASMTITWLLTIKENSFKSIISKEKDALLTGLFSSSSTSTLPYTVAASQSITKDEKFSILVPSLGTSMGLIMVGFFPVTNALITAINTPDFVMDAQFYITLFIITIFVSIGIAGTPGMGSITSIMILENMGLSTEFFTTVALTLDPLLDPFRTSANISAIIAGTTLSSKISNFFLKKKHKKTYKPNEIVIDLESEFSSGETLTYKMEIESYFDSQVQKQQNIKNNFATQEEITEEIYVTEIDLHKSDNQGDLSKKPKKYKGFKTLKEEKDEEVTYEENVESYVYDENLNLENFDNEKETNVW